MTAEEAGRGKVQPQVEDGRRGDPSVQRHRLDHAEHEEEKTRLRARAEDEPERLVPAEVEDGPVADAQQARRHASARQGQGGLVDQVLQVLR